MRKEFGKEYKDLITDFVGYGSAVCFYDTGCVQLLLSPKVDKNGNYRNNLWHDIGGLRCKDGKQVLIDPKRKEFGKEYKDTTSGFTGRCTGVVEFKTHIQLLLSPRVDKDGNSRKSIWVDKINLEKTNSVQIFINETANKVIGYKTPASAKN